MNLHQLQRLQHNLLRLNHLLNLLRLNHRLNLLRLNRQLNLLRRNRLLSLLRRNRPLSLLQHNRPLSLLQHNRQLSLQQINLRQTQVRTALTPSYPTPSTTYTSFTSCSQVFHFQMQTVLFWSQQIARKTASSVDPDEMAHSEPSHQNLHCLQRK